MYPERHLRPMTRGREIQGVRAMTTSAIVPDTVTGDQVQNELARLLHEQELAEEERRAHERQETLKQKAEERAAFDAPVFQDVRSFPRRSDAQQILRQLDPGEVVQLAVPAFRPGFGNGGVLALTDRRLIFWGKPEVLSIPLGDIASAEIEERPIYANLRMVVRGDAITFSQIRPKKRAWELLGHLVLLGETPTPADEVTGRSEE